MEHVCYGISRTSLTGVGMGVGGQKALSILCRKLSAIPILSKVKVKVSSLKIIDK